MGKKIPIWQTLLVVLFLLVMLFFNIRAGNDAHISLICAGIVGALVAILNGYKWSFIEKGILAGIDRSMQACLILMVVGSMIASWIAGGIVPGMIFYGLKILSPGIYLIAACLICSIVSLATGSSWTTAGTVGVALIGVGMGLGIPAGMCAGAIVSGAYFGDKMSPLSDTTNLAPAIAGSNLFDHIRHMCYTTGTSYVIILVLYGILGVRFAGQDLDHATIDALLTGITDNFSINLLMLIPPILVILMVVFRVPAIPGLIGGIAVGCVYAAFQGVHFIDLMGILHYGWESDTGIEALDDLLTRGGLDSMMWTISLIICAMTFGGILDCTDQLKNLAGAILKLAKSTGALVTTTIFSCFFMNIIASDQYLAIILPGRMYKEAFEDKRLKPKNLSRCLEDSGTLTSPLVPWNTCGTTMATFLGVPTFTYAPYAFLNILNPFVSIIFGFTGITMEKMSEEDYQEILKRRELDRAEAAAAAATKA